MVSVNRGRIEASHNQSLPQSRGGPSHKFCPGPVYEPTGAYHGHFEQPLLQAELPVAKVNPRQARRFVEATGRLAKTDAVDAEVLATMGQALALRPTPARSCTRRELKELSVARDALVKDRVAASNRCGHLHSPPAQAPKRHALRSIERHSNAIKARIEQFLRRNKALARRLQILTSVPGVGPVTSAGLLTDMPDLGARNPKTAASLAGLAPQACDSGQWRGRRVVHGGRHRVRQRLYMVAVVASRWNPDLERLYTRLCNAGNPQRWPSPP